MSAGDTMQGVRVIGKGPHELQIGEYGRWAGDQGNWYGCCPDGQLANLTRHDVLEHPDGTITVAPSILVTGGPPAARTQWHGYLERGVWREV